MSLKQCCATGSLHTGTPTGHVERIHGLDCYIVDAPNGSPKGVVVIIPDAFGWTLPNNRILADCYAKEGNFQVYLPEFMNGTGVPAGAIISLKAMSATGFWAQLAKFSHAVYLARCMIPFLINCWPSIAGPRVWKFLRDLKTNESKDLPVATAGFCWGGSFVTKLCWDQVENRSEDGKTRSTDVGFVAHPSFLTYPQDINMIVLPYSCAASEIDPQMSPEQATQTEEILKKKTENTKGQGVDHEFVMYEKAHHGFAVRADEGDLLEAEAGKKAEKQALNWFSRWFANPPP